ncbi:MAG: hypothetical protein F4Y70_14140 [Chloroflexi bacterium]|nr:hypothetical protein [Chloroflexota bacterium]MXX84585.1 hypothetical protein [Chloroflexota bacterium]MYA92592.1 hypothetical protein [Chloroflexota bacterium]MYC56166.1 hypothetical protein [Chloroflexota bacterium]MYH65129.1 hypothetical protein [Chloroflexota bacterium]
MKKKQFALFEPGGRQVRGFSYGKLVEVRYLDVVPVGIESSSRQDFLEQLRAALDEFGAEKISECRVGYVDDNGVGDYYDALEFLANDGMMMPPANITDIGA